MATTKLVHITKAYEALEQLANKTAKKVPVGEKYSSHRTTQYRMGSNTIGVELLVYTTNAKGNIVSRKIDFEKKGEIICDKSTEYSTMFKEKK